MEQRRRVQRALEADQARLADRASKVNRLSASRSDSPPSFCLTITTATINGGTDRRRSVNRSEKNSSRNRWRPCHYSRDCR